MIDDKELTRDEKLRHLRKACMKANPALWNDHGDVLKRVVSQGVAVPTQIGIADVLLAWNWEWQKEQPVQDSDEDAGQVYKEVIAQIISVWNMKTDDLSKQTDECIDYLSSRIHYVPRTYGPARSITRKSARLRPKRGA
jgi:hypothetical protein